MREHSRAFLRKNACPVRFTVFSAQSRFEIFWRAAVPCIAQERGFDSADQEGWCPEKIMFPGPWGFPFHMGGSQGEGRRRRRRSSDSSRSRDRRRRSARRRSRRSRSPARSERSQPQTAPLPPPPNVISLPQPQAGYVWQQVPAVPQMMPPAQAPKAIVTVPSAFQQSWDQKGYRASSWQSQPRQTKPWNKYNGKDCLGGGSDGPL